MTAVEWRDIPGYEGYYQASSDGQIRSLDRIVPRLLRGVFGTTTKRGCVLVGSVNKNNHYRMVAVRRDGGRRMRPVHTLVLETFTGPRPEAMDGCHRDGDRMNNAISNLYWGTRAENIEDAVRHGTAHWKTRTHCPNNHPYDDDSPEAFGRLGVKGPGTVRKCRICSRAASRRYYARKLARERMGIAA